MEASISSEMDPLIHKLSHIVALYRPQQQALSANCRPVRLYPARAQLLAQKQAVTERRVVLGGWACHTRLLADGRRQIMHLLLPGDFIGTASRRGTLSCSTVIALTPVTVATIGDLEDTTFEAAFQICDSLTEAYLMNQIMRLGRQSAQERLAHLLLEIRSRLDLAGLGGRGRFDFPLTQDVLADVLGITNVHVNRTLQNMRASGLIELSGRTFRIKDQPALESLAEYHAPIVAPWQEDG
jgi:CRP-like cAMP-binding protein